ncbi:MAG TPA: DMT family transporter [Stellaceae bacterium]
MSSPPAQSARLSASSLVLLAGIALTWGCNWPALKVALGEIPIATLRAICLLGGGVAFLLFARIGGERLRLPARDEWGPLLLVTACNIVAWHLGTAVGVMLLPAGRSSILAFTMPIWAALFDRVLFGSRLGLARTLGFALGGLGIAVLLLPDLAALLNAPLGVIAMLGAAVGWALGSLLMKRVRWRIPPQQLTAWQLLLGGLPFAAGALAIDPLARLTAVHAPTWAIVAYIVALPMVFAYWAWFKLLRRLPSSVAAISTLCVPVVGLLSSAALLHEAIGLQEVAALVLVGCGVALVLLVPAPVPPSPAAVPAAPRPRRHAA